MLPVTLRDEGLVLSVSKAFVIQGFWTNSSKTNLLRRVKQPENSMFSQGQMPHLVLYPQLALSLDFHTESSL